MRHFKSLTYQLPLKAERCVSIPLVPAMAPLVDLKLLLGYEIVESDRDGVTFMCKG